MIEEDGKDIQIIASVVTDMFGNLCKFDTDKESGSTESLTKIASIFFCCIWKSTTYKILTSGKRKWKPIFNSICRYKNINKLAVSLKKRSSIHLTIMVIRKIWR